MIPLKYLLESPDDIWYPEANPIAIGLIAGRWMYAFGATNMATHLVMSRAIQGVATGKLHSLDNYEMFPPFLSEKEQQEWVAKAEKAIMDSRADPNGRPDFRGGFEITGRLTSKRTERLKSWNNGEDLICAFWEDTKTVRQHLPAIERLFHHLNLPIEQYTFEPIDVKWNPSTYRMSSLTYQDLKGTKPVHSRSSEEIKKLRQIQHVDPVAKRKLLGAVGGAAKEGQFAKSMGFPNAASFRFYTQQESADPFTDYASQQGWMDPHGKFYPLRDSTLKSIWGEFGHHHEWAYNYLVQQGKLEDMLKDIDSNSEDWMDQLELGWDAAADILYDEGWLRISPQSGEINFSGGMAGPGVPTAAQKRVLVDTAIEQNKQLINGHGNIVFGGEKSSEPTQARFAINYRPEKPKSMSAAEFNYLRGESTDWSGDPDNDDLNGDGWLDITGKFYAIGVGILHQEWAYKFLVKQGKIKDTIGAEEEGYWMTEEEKENEWDKAADILYKNGWQRIVRFKTSIHFWGTKPLNFKQGTELKNMAIEENRFVINSKTETLYFSPNKKTTYAPERKMKSWMGLKVQKPTGISMAQFHFLRGESTINEDSQHHIWLGVVDSHGHVRAERVLQKNKTKWDEFEPIISHGELGLDFGGSKWRYNEGSNTVFWWGDWNDDDQTVVNNYLAKHGFLNLKHEGYLQKPMNWRLAHGRYEKIPIAYKYGDKVYHYKTIGDSTETTSKVLTEEPYVYKPGNIGQFDLELERFVHSNDPQGCIKYIHHILSGKPAIDKYGNAIMLEPDDVDEFKRTLLHNPQFDLTMRKLGLQAHKVFWPQYVESKSFKQFSEATAWDKACAAAIKGTSKKICSQCKGKGCVDCDGAGIRYEFKTYAQLPADWKAKYPKKFWNNWALMRYPIALGVVYKNRVEAKALNAGNDYLDHCDLKWKVLSNKDPSHVKQWELGKNNVVSWVNGVPTKHEMDLVDSYLIQRKIRPFSHGDNLNFGGPYCTYSLKYRSPDYYRTHPIKIIPMQAVDVPPQTMPNKPTTAQWRYAHGESYKQNPSFQQYCEDMFASGGGAFGSFGGYGGHVGNTDFYAAGDARVPTVLGPIQRRPAFQKKRKKRKRKYLKESKINPLMLAFDSRMRSDSNYMGRNTDALMDLIPATDYQSPAEWLAAVEQQVGKEAIPGGYHHYRTAISSANWDMTDPSRSETREYYKQKANEL